MQVITSKRAGVNGLNVEDARKRLGALLRLAGFCLLLLLATALGMLASALV